MDSFFEYCKKMNERAELGSLYLDFGTKDILDKALQILKPFNIKHKVTGTTVSFGGISDVVAQRLMKALKKDKIKFSKD